MRRLTLKALLVWSVLLGVLPADRCVLKMAGVCACDLQRNDHKSGCCHANQNDSAPLNSEHKSCCVITPADGLVTSAPVLPVVSALDGLPRISVFETLLLASVFEAPAPVAGPPPQPPDTPLYLRVHAFLI